MTDGNRQAVLDHRTKTERIATPRPSLLQSGVLAVARNAYADPDAWPEHDKDTSKRDTLALFIANEIASVTEGETDFREVLRKASSALAHAVAEIEEVIDALDAKIDVLDTMQADTLQESAVA